MTTSTVHNKRRRRRDAAPGGTRRRRIPTLLATVAALGASLLVTAAPAHATSGWDTEQNTAFGEGQVASSTLEWSATGYTPNVITHQVRIWGGILQHRARSEHSDLYGPVDWTPWAVIVDGYGGAYSMAATRVSIALGADTTLHVVAISTNGLLYYSQRRPNGTWTGFAQMAGVNWPVMGAKEIEVAISDYGSGNEGWLEVAAIGTADGKLYHTERNPYIDTFSPWGTAYAGGDATSVRADPWHHPFGPPEPNDGTVRYVINTTGHGYLTSNRASNGGWTPWTT